MAFDDDLFCLVDDYVDAQTEEDKMPAEANKKRKLKTPAQLQALEEYYEGTFSVHPVAVSLIFVW